MSKEIVMPILLRAHREMEEHLAEAKEWIVRIKETGAAALDELKTALAAFGRVIEADLALHIAHEDKALFPVLAEKTGWEGPVQQMMDEHRVLEQHTETYHRGLVEKNPEAVAEATHGIVEVMTEHIEKEESILFPMAENMLDNDDWQQVMEMIQAQNAG